MSARVGGPSLFSSKSEGDMSKNIFIEGTSVEDFFRQVHGVIREANSDLRAEVKELRKQIREGSRMAVSHRAAPLYFDDSISAERVLDYIHGRNLPQGASGPLPARKMGNAYYIKVRDIENWQLGQS